MCQALLDWLQFSHRASLGALFFWRASTEPPPRLIPPKMIVNGFADDRMHLASGF